MKISCLALLLFPLLARATESSPIPELGEHAFVPLAQVAEPFLSHHVHIEVQLGNSSNTLTPEYTLPDGTVVPATDSELLYSGLRFWYQHRMKEWLAVGVRIAATGQLGTNTPTLVSSGVTANVGYTVDWKLQLLSTESVLLSSSLALSNNAATFINLLDWVADVAAGTGSSLIRRRDVLRGAVGLHAGWGISRRFGLLLSAVSDYGEPFLESRSNDWLNSGNLALSYDLREDIGVPLGLAVFVEFNDSAIDVDANTVRWGGRLALQSRRDFTIGMDFSQTDLTDPVFGTDVHVRQISIDMRYYY